MTVRENEKSAWSDTTQTAFDTWQKSWVIATEARKNMDKASKELEKALLDEQDKWQANCDHIKSQYNQNLAIPMGTGRIVCNNSFKDFT